MISAPISTLDSSEVFTQHKSVLNGGGSVIKHCTSIFSPTAVVAYIPTGVTAVGPIQIEALMGQFSQETHSVVKEQVLSRTVTPSQVVEETLLTLSHKDSIKWLLPGVKATGKEINITIMAFDEAGKVTSKRVYWDQASVLRQLGVLPKSLYCRSNSSEVTLPIVGSEIASALYANSFDHVSHVEQAVETMSVTSEENKRLNPRRNESENIFNMEPLPFRPSSRVLSRPGGKPSDIFGVNPVEQTTQKAHLAAPGGPALNLFDDEPVQASVNQIDRRDPNWSNAEKEVEPRLSRFTGQTNQSHFSFGNDEVQETVAPRKNPQAMQTSFSFSQDQEAPIANTRVRRDPNAQSQSVEARPSSRVLSRPGGKVNFTFA